MSLIPCTGIHFKDPAITCKRKKSCVRWDEDVAGNKAQLIVGINIKSVDECIFFVEVV
jgi:hypothetical protein